MTRGRMSRARRARLTRTLLVLLVLVLLVLAWHAPTELPWTGVGIDIPAWHGVE